MSLRGFRKQGGGDEDSFRKQSNVEAALGPLRSILILDGTLVEDVAIGTTETLVPHKLNRQIRGYIIVKNNTLTAVAATNGTFDKNLFLGLIASSACTVSLWIF